MCVFSSVDGLGLCSVWNRAGEAADVRVGVCVRLVWMGFGVRGAFGVCGCVELERCDSKCDRVCVVCVFAEGGLDPCSHRTAQRACRWCRVLAEAQMTVTGGTRVGNSAGMVVAKGDL
jgi:adhesin HecA-like repeat protein